MFQGMCDVTRNPSDMDRVGGAPRSAADDAVVFLVITVELQGAASGRARNTMSDMCLFHILPWLPTRDMIPNRSA